MEWKDNSGERHLSEIQPDGSVLAHSCVQGVSSGKDKSNDRYKQIREVCSKPTIQNQEGGETGTSLWGERG